MIFVYVFVYLAAIVLANFIVLWFGPTATIFNAFVLIGLDLSMRDKLHDLWRGKKLVLKMGMLIFAGSAITWLLNAEAGRIALASVIAFSTAAIVDTLLYTLYYKKSFLVKANISNVGGSLADSILFPTVAFGSFLPFIILGQFTAKFLGGFIWAYIIDFFREKDYNKA